MHVLAYRKLFDERGVPSFVSGALNDVASGIAERSLDIVVRKRAGIEQGPRDAGRGVGIADQGGASAIKADGSTAMGIGNRNNVSSGVVIAGGSGKDPAHLPIAKNLVHKAGSIFGKHASTAEGQVVNIAEDEAMTHVEIGITVFSIGEALGAEVSLVQRSQAGARCVVEGVRKGGSRLIVQPVREAFLHANLQRVVVRLRI